MGKVSNNLQKNNYKLQKDFGSIVGGLHIFWWSPTVVVGWAAHHCHWASMVNGVHILPATPKNAHLQNDLIQKLVLQYLGIQISNRTLYTIYEDNLYFCHAYTVFFWEIRFR